MFNSFLGVATILYETRLGCLENEIPKMSQEYIAALHLMFSSFKTTMYAGAIPKWLRPIIPKPWEEFCSSWDGLFRFSKSRGNCGGVQCHCDKVGFLQLCSLQFFLLKVCINVCFRSDSCGQEAFRYQKEDEER